MHDVPPRFGNLEIDNYFFPALLRYAGLFLQGLSLEYFLNRGIGGLEPPGRNCLGGLLALVLEDEQGSGRHRAVIFQVTSYLEFWGLFLFFFCSSGG